MKNYRSDSPTSKMHEKMSQTSLSKLLISPSKYPKKNQTER